MARIKIKDLPKDMKISREEMKKVMGGSGSFQGSLITVAPLNMRSSLINFGAPLNEAAPIR
jgi:hypothetical protein